MNIVNLNIDKLIPYINNPRNNDNAIDKVAASIREFGFKVPIIVDENYTVVTGHTRLLASKKLGLEEVPCVIVDDLSDAQIKAFRIADNKVSEYASWDYDLLNIELDKLNELDFDMTDLGLNYHFDNEFEEEVQFEDVDEELENEYIGNDSFIDYLANTEFYQQGKVKTSNIYNITFSFPLNYKDEVLEYIKDYGKDYIINDIVEKALKNKGGK